MKKFFTSICLILALSLSSVTAFAAEPATAVSEDMNTAETMAVAMPRQQGLWYKSDTFFMGLINADVTPTKGTELRVWVKSDNAIRVTVYETNFFGTYSEVFSEQYGAGERDVSVVSKCNGKKYVVQFRNDDGVTFSALIYER